MRFKSRLIVHLLWYSKNLNHDLPTNQRELEIGLRRFGFFPCGTKWPTTLLAVLGSYLALSGLHVGYLRFDLIGDLCRNRLAIDLLSRLTPYSSD